MQRYVLLIVGFLLLPSCSGCRREADSIQVNADSLHLTTPPPKPEPTPTAPTGPRTFYITGKPSTDSTPPSVTAPSTTPSPLSIVAAPKPPSVPPGVVEDQSLTQRLQERMKEVKIEMSDKDPPKIYLSQQSLDEFSKYYEARGQKVNRMSIKAGDMLRPVLQEHPELAGKIDINAMDGITINQVVVEGTGISAADKYIDPATYQIVDKLFVTEMPGAAGR